MLTVNPCTSLPATGIGVESAVFVEAGKFQCFGDGFEKLFELISGERAVGSCLDASVALAYEGSAVETVKGTQPASGVFAGGLGLVGTGHNMTE
jgi:hypothetical protein